jgi:YfiH family protein
MGGFELDLGTERCSARIPLGPIDGQIDSGPKDSGLRGWISLKRAGDMGSSARRSSPGRIRYLASLGIQADRPVYSCHQVHSQRVVTVTNQDPDELSEIEADGLISNRRDAVLTVTVADCLPIYLVDPQHGVFALLHSGWRGTGIAVQALKRMEEEYGSRPSRVEVSIGPGIGSCCYRVEEDRYRQFLDRFGRRSVRKHQGAFFLDLAAANFGLLTHWGVRKIRICRNCTACTPQLSSFRMDGPKFGHMLACIGEINDDQI